MKCRIIGLACALWLIGCNPGKYMDVGSYVPEAINQAPQLREWYHPRGLFQEPLPSGSDTYSRGFRDGCQSATGYAGHGLQQFQQFKMDVKLAARDLPYNTGFKDGMDHCLYFNDWGPD